MELREFEPQPPVGASYVIEDGVIPLLIDRGVKLLMGPLSINLFDELGCWRHAPHAVIS
jgi:hypothetical protein